VPDAVLEIRDAGSAFDRIEEWLAGRGFFMAGGAELVADVYLGYGLSQSIRRGATPAPPEPCRALPLAACRIVSVGSLATDCYKAPLEIGKWQRSWTDAEYCAAVDEVRDAIARGDVYQVNLVQHLQAPFAGDPDELAERLAQLQPLLPGTFAGDGWAVVSASPELFLSRRGDRIWTMPIKGTRPRGGAAELRASDKDAAEHVMIVDLERNDLSRVCEAGTVRWPELMTTRELAGVEHMVSTVEGTLREGIGLAEILRATFPGGSVTGAPKIAAVDLIAQFEPVGRGASMGAVGRIYGNGDIDLALTIRTFAIADGAIHFWVGGGIVWDSDPAAEVEESWIKARPLVDAIGSRLPEGGARLSTARRRLAVTGVAA
jgi:para-aminobenzoate synthetase component 1